MVYNAPRNNYNSILSWQNLVYTNVPEFKAGLSSFFAVWMESIKQFGLRHLIQIVDEGLTFIFKEDALASQLPRLIKEWRKGCLFLKQKKNQEKK